MLKAKTIGAVRLELADGVQAVLVQDGDEWCTLRRFKCVAPEAFKGDILVVGPAEEHSTFAEFFGSVFGRINELPIVMASPRLGATIKAINASTSSGSGQAA